MTAREQELVAKEVAAIKDYIQATVDRGTQPLREELDRMTTTVQQALAAQREQRRAALSASITGSQPRVPFGKYQGMTPLDLAIVASIYKAQPPRVDGSPGYAQMYEQWGPSLKAAMDSTTATSGDELVSTQEARDLWMDVNLETAVASLLTRVDMPSNPFEIPLQLGDVNWYPGTENVATKSTNLTTKKQTLTAYELVSEVPWSLTLDEDSVIAMMEEVRRSLVRNAAEVIDDVLLNADTVTTTANINNDSVAIAATDAGKGHWLLGFDGLIKLPLVDNTAQSVNLAGAITEAAFNKNRLLAARFGVNPSQAVYVMDLNTFIAAQTMTNIRTLDKFGPQATIFTGQLGAMEGIPIIVSEQMKLAASNGKVHATTGNTTGRLLLFNRTQWRVGFRRQLTIETTRDIQKRQNIMVVSFRIALQEQSGTRSTAKHTTLQYNITGVT